MRLRGIQFVALFALLAPMIGRAQQEVPEVEEPEATAVDPPDDEGDDEAADQGEVQDILETMTARLARERNQEGIAALNAEPPNLPKALEAFQAAYSFDKEDVEIVNNLGFVYAELGNLERAEPLLREALQRAPERLVAHVNLADVLIAQGSDQALREARKLLARARELAGNDPELIERQAVVARRSSDETAALRFYREAIALDGDDFELLLTLGDYYRELARDDEAAEWYRRIPRSSELYPRARERIEQLEIEREARRYGWSPATREVSQRVRRLVRRADELLARGQLVAAEQVARQAANEAPQYADAHRVLGDTLAARGEAALAAYLRGFVVEPNNADLIRRIALTYRDSGRNAEASVLLARALQLRPDWQELRLDHALALRSSGDLPGALREVSRFLEAGQGVAREAQARKLERELTALLKPDGAGPKSDADPAPPKDVAECLNRARVLLSRGQSDAALATLDCGDEPEVRRLRARILIASDRPEEAREVLARVVAEHPSDAEAHYELGRLQRSADDLSAAWDSFVAAESLGMHDATYQLAELDFLAGAPERWPWPRSTERLLRARGRFRAYLERSGGTFADAARARMLQLEELAWGFAIAVATTLLGLAATSWLWYRRRRGGHDLRSFLRRRPEAGGEVQSVLAAIRHEVLKHNTTALEGLLTSLRRMDDVDADLQRFERALFEEPGGVARRLEHYVDELEQIGRKHEVRVNLRGRDAVIGALLQGFAFLERVRPLLAQPKAHQRRRLIRALERASARLNDDAYRAVHDLLRELRELTVDEGLLRGLARRAMSEPSMRSHDVEPVELFGDEVLPRAALAPRTLFDDILINLLRNALQASAAAALGPIRIAIGVALDEDDLTGVSYLVLTVYDQAERAVEYEMIESASFASGLGIAREAASRCDAILAPAPGRGRYRKGVAISFVVAESEALVEPPSWEMAS